MWVLLRGRSVELLRFVSSRAFRGSISGWVLPPTRLERISRSERDRGEKMEKNGAPKSRDRGVKVA